MRAVVLIAAALAVLPLTGSDARADGPWCAYDVRGGTNCGFHSYAQCQAYLSGIGGSCARISTFVPLPPISGGASATDEAGRIIPAPAHCGLYHGKPTTPARSSSAIRR